MPRPTVTEQIAMKRNGTCKSCGIAIDYRALRCGPCHLLRVAKRRFPARSRPRLNCRDCGASISRNSTKGRSRCRACYNLWRCEPRPHRDASRPGAGTCYQDKDGEIRYSDEPLGGSLTVSSAWACLRKNWRGFIIARGQCNESRMAMYAKRIHRLQRVLNLEQTEIEYG